MAGNSSIEWTRGDDGSKGKTWNPLAGCTRVSPGCDNCYAASMSLRLEGMAKAAEEAGRNPGGSAKYIGVANRNKQGTAVFNGTINLDYEALTQPLRWRKPSRIFVNSMSDLFHKDVPFSFVEQVFAIMDKAPHHTYQVLTKRPDRAAEFYGGRQTGKHIWMGTSVENQEVANERIPHLLKIPAHVRFLSCEPLLGPVDLRQPGCPEMVWDGPYQFRCGKGGDGNVCATHGEFTRRIDGIHWVIAGGESGPNARPMNPIWARSLRDQCQRSGIAFFFKQWGKWLPFGQKHATWDHESASYFDKLAAEKEVFRFQPIFGIPNSSRTMYSVGKKEAGRLLDGREWNEFPHQGKQQ